MKLQPENQNPVFPMLSEVVQGADLALLPDAWRPIIRPHLEALQRAENRVCDFISEDPHINDSRQLFRIISENGGPDISELSPDDLNDVYNGLLATFNNPEFNYRLGLLSPWPSSQLR